MAVQELPEAAGIGLANWNWRVVHQFVSERFGLSLSRSSCLNYLHRLGFAFKRPKRRLLKADEAKWESFMVEYGALWDEAERTGGKIFFVDEAHFPGGRRTAGQVGAERDPGSGGLDQPAVWGEGQLLFGGLLGDGRGGVDGTGGQQQLRDLGGLPKPVAAEALWAIERDLGRCPGGALGKLRSGAAVREYLRTPGLELRLVNLPGYSPDFNADEAIWGWVREEATGNLCLGSKAAVQQRVGSFLAGLASRSGEVKRRCRTALQSRAEALLPDSQPDSRRPANAHPTLALV